MSAVLGRKIRVGYWESQEQSQIGISASMSFHFRLFFPLAHFVLEGKRLTYGPVIRRTSSGCVGVDGVDDV